MPRPNLIPGERTRSTDASKIHIPKRIIICCDGTWQSAESGKRSSPSNITRLSRSIAPVGIDASQKVWQQIVWYDSGVGTTSSWIGQKNEGASGLGLEGNVIEAYNFIAQNYRPGDQIFCFGFSRGAYTARSIAGLITDIGICEPRNLQYFPDIWELYKKGTPGERFYGSDAWFGWLDGKLAADQPVDDGKYKPKVKWDRKPQGDWAVTPESREVQVVGVYDTVGALGMPKLRGYELPFGPDKPGWHNVRLNPNVKHAFHALALDEYREAFTPTLWHLPSPDENLPSKAEVEKAVSDAADKWYTIQRDPKASATDKDSAKTAYNAARKARIFFEEAQKPASELLQVWFPGVHINIGGGDADALKNKGDLEEMSNITYAWMLDQIDPYLNIQEGVFHQETMARQEHINEINRKIDEESEKRKQQKALIEAHKESWTQYGARLASSAASIVTYPFSGKSEAQRRDYGWGTGTYIDSYSLIYIVNGPKQRTPGKYQYEKKINDEKEKVVGATNEMVHPCVGYRMYKTEKVKDEAGNLVLYNPIGMERDKFYRKKKQGGKGFEYVIGDVVLDEYELKGQAEDWMYQPFERYTIVGEEALKYIARDGI